MAQHGASAVWPIHVNSNDERHRVLVRVSRPVANRHLVGPQPGLADDEDLEIHGIIANESQGSAREESRRVAE